MADLDAFMDKYDQSRDKRLNHAFTRDYLFYDGSVRLRYDIQEHKYYLVTDDGLEALPGCSSVSHIIDKSDALVPWACKMMEQSFFQKTQVYRDSDFPNITWGELDEIVRMSKTAHKAQLEEAGNIGHIAHDWIETYIKAKIVKSEHDMPMPEDERARNACLSALKWMAQHKVQWICTERKVYSRRFKYAGTMDGLCYISSCDDPTCCHEDFAHALSVIDWKTSNSLYSDYILQIASYAYAYIEETNEKVTDCWLIRLGKDDAKFEPWHLTKQMIELGFKAFRQAMGLTESIDSLKVQIKDLKDLGVQARKQAKIAARAEQATISCHKSVTYKGIRIPQCNGGKGCKACWDKYFDRHPQYVAGLTTH